MASTIVPSNILDGLNVSQTPIRTQFTNAASDIVALQVPEYVVLTATGTLTNERVLTGTADQITITDGGAGAAVTLTISNNPVLPGTGSVTVPIGTTAQRPGTPVNGMIRYNSDLSTLEAYVAGTWQPIESGGGVSSVNGLTGALTLATGTAGTDFAISAAGATITFDLPDASATARGVITTGTQTIAGNKTFTGIVRVTGSSAFPGYAVFTPISGDTVALTAVPYTFIDPAGTLATLTLDLPGTGLTDGLVLSITTSQQITSLTLNPVAPTTVLNAPASLASGSFIKYMYRTAADIWSPVG